MFKGMCIAAASDAGEIRGLGRAASSPDGEVCFNTTAWIQDVEDEIQPLEAKREIITQKDPELRDAVEELHEKFQKVLDKGKNHPRVKEAVHKFLPTTDTKSLMRFVEEAKSILDSIEMKFDTNVTMESKKLAGGNPLGAYNHTNFEIFINPSIKGSKRKVTLAVMHEIMHATGTPENAADALYEIYGEPQCEDLAKGLAKGPKGEDLDKDYALDNADSWYWAIESAARGN